MTESDSWTDRRRHAAAEHAAAHRRRRESETGQARALIAEFVDAANRLGIAAKPLRALGYDGRSSYRTKLRGWLLHTDGRLAVGTDGEFYVLTVPTSLRGLLLGVHVPPHDPPLQIGRGAGDGESIALSELLDRRLAQQAEP